MVIGEEHWAQALHKVTLHWKHLIWSQQYPVKLLESLSSLGGRGKGHC